MKLITPLILGRVSNFLYLCRKLTQIRRMKIVQLDGYAANPGDMDMRQWHCIEDADGSMCEFVSYDRTVPELVVERAKDADAIIINKVLITDDVMSSLPRLRYIGVLATGYNVVDITSAHRRGIVVTNIPAYSTASVAQLVFAHILNVANRVAFHADAVRNGEWGRCQDFTFTLTPQLELAGQCIGIIGFGNTGRATAAIAHAFGMRVMVAPTLRDGGSHAQLPEYAVEAETWEAFFREADIVSLHCPLTERTRGIINARTLNMMKSTAMVINTGRGPLVDEEALASALNSGRIAAAGVDVLCEEPPKDGSPLLTARNCYVTPHIAWATRAARQRLMDIAVENVRAFIRGEDRNCI